MILIETTNGVYELEATNVPEALEMLEEYKKENNKRATPIKATYTEDGKEVTIEFCWNCGQPLTTTHADIFCKTCRKMCAAQLKHESGILPGHYKNR
jgi:hypothetical protein